MRIIDIEWWQNMGMDCSRGGGNRKCRTRHENYRTRMHGGRTWNGGRSFRECFVVTARKEMTKVS
jgi:hypothetical protein